VIEAGFHEMSIERIRGGEIDGSAIGLHQDPSLRSRLDCGVVDRFVPVGPRNYHDMCEAAGFMELR
jgi:hypothetical protein